MSTNKISVQLVQASETDRLYGSAEHTPNLFVDGMALASHFSDEELDNATTPAQRIPFTRSNIAEHLHDTDLLRSELLENLGFEYSAWAGVAALLVEGSGFPFGLIPVFTCMCTNEYCGYFACSMTMDGESVIWSNFALVWPSFTEHSESPSHAEIWQSSPTSTAVVFRFEWNEYELALTSLLRLSATAFQRKPTIAARIKRWIGNLTPTRLLHND